MFGELANRIQSLDINKIILELLNSAEIKERLETNNRERLTFKGEDYEGNKLRTYNAEGGDVYSKFTMNVRAAEGKQFRHVDLLNEGKFHESFKAVAKDGGLVIEANFDKPDGNIADNLDVSKVLGFTDEDIDEVSNLLYPMLLNRIQEIIQI